ncbi:MULTISPECIES: multidrug effflux MFS transporter [Flammeovirga]|uniref:Multidrug effflux MFS transporter n=1 Tax=Flammeovirga agarivorans TaxID=2726742 RepID=A0A7X8SKF7_9BACT|nr:MULTISPECIES: multidrug effflux MFS transporter [Flammeovirga]NLR91763.1 multidrug effflux MFS transporter [Flammeovirga agarivorans]
MNKKERNFFVLLLGALAMIGPFNIDTCLPALGQIAEDFGVPFQKVELSMSLFFFFFGFGQLFGGYYSDRLGRKWIVSAGLIIATIGSVFLVFTQSLEMFYGGRALQAIGGGFVGVSIAAIVRDRFQGKEAASIMSLVMMIAMGAPLVAPTIGAGLLQQFGWPSIFIFIAIYMVAVFIPLQLKVTNRVPENASNMTFFKGIKTVYSNKPALAYMSAMAVPSGALYTYLTTAPFVYQEYFGLNASNFALLFGLNGGALIIMNKLNSVLVKTYSPRKLLHIGLGIHISTLAIILSTISVAEPNMYIVLPLLTAHLSSLGFLSGNATSIALEKYQKNVAGLANSQMRVVGIAIGSLAGAIASSFNNGTLFPPFIVMFTCSTLGILLYVTLKKHDLDRRSI